MVEKFDFDLFGKVGETPPSLIVDVNGQSMPEDNGFILVSGKIGTLGVCADGRIEFLPYPVEVRSLSSVKDEFVLKTSEGKRVRVNYWWHKKRLYSKIS